MGVTDMLCDAKEVYEKFYRYLVDKDLSGLNKSLDISFGLIHMTGMQQNKFEFIRCVANGTLNYFSNVQESVKAYR